MYGFIEKWLADVLKLNYEPYLMNDGGMAAIIDRTDFILVKRLLVNIWKESGDSDQLTPKECESDVVGMRIILHKYWNNINVLHGLSSGELKTQENYLAIMELGPNRFNVYEFENLQLVRDFIRNANNEEREEGNNSEETQENNTQENNEESEQEENNEEAERAEVTENIEPEKPVISEKEAFLKNIYDKFIHIAVINHTENNNSVVSITNSHPKCLDDIIWLSQRLDKNIIICNDSNYSHIKNFFNKNGNPTNISKHTILISFNPIQHVNNFRPHKVTGSKDGSTICFGERVNSLCLVYDNGQDKAESIRRDDSLSSEDQEKKIKEMSNKSYISSYHRYDKIFKDYSTNVVWALKDRSFVYFMFPARENETLLRKCIKEFGNRFNGDLTKKEMISIDKKYYSSISENDKKEYIKFAVDNASNLLEKLKKLYEKAESDYKESISKAMEYGKLATKFKDQLSAFNESEFEDKERKRALDSYDETLKIPEVLSINITGQIVNIYTKNLYAQDDRTKKWYDIGTFHIMLGIISNQYDIDNSVKIINTKHQVKAYADGIMQAPHVFEDGHICHGTLAAGMVEAYKRRNLFELVYQIVLFLQTANTDDSAGKYINSWPEVSEEVALAPFDSGGENEKIIKSEVEEKFDNMLADAIPVHI